MKQWTMIWHQALTCAMFGGRSLRNKKTVVFPITAPVSGEKLRIRFANHFGKKPYHVGAMTVWVDGMPHTVTMNEKHAFCVPTGGVVYSDVLDLPVAAGMELELRLYTTNRVNDCNAIEERTNLLQGDGTKAALTENIHKSRFVEALNANNSIPVIEAVELFAERGKAIVAFGDSITAQSRWTKPLADRLITKYHGEYILLNAGISGNCLLYEAAGIFGATYGEKGTTRFARDVLEIPKLHAVIFGLGVNDAAYLSEKTAELLCLANYQKAVTEIVEKLRERDVRVIMQTITPRMDVDRSMGVYTEKMEALRLAYNEWIRTAGLFDYMFDAEAVVREEGSDGIRFRDGLHLGDHLHPNAEGGRLLADAYDLSKLTGEIA